MDRKDYLLLVIASGGANPLTPVQLQKSLFLIAQNLPGIPEPFYDFEPYHYGPFDVSIYDDVHQLEVDGLVSAIPSPVGTWKNRAITPNGLKRAKQLRKQMSRPVRDYIQDLVRWTQSLSFTELVQYIYSQYPQYRANSVFQG